jgi:putative polyketide hydroxylase
LFPHTPRTRTEGDPPDRVDVMIVGAGPAGLVAGITLARYGVGCLVVDRRTEPEPHPRATVVSLRTMELLRSWDLEDQVRRGGDDVEWLLLVCRSLAEAEHGETVEVGYPTKEQSVLLSPTSPACVPQDHLETVLLGHLRSFPSVRLQLGVSVEDVRLHADQVHVALRDLASGTMRTVAARYVVGADGARSVVRERLGIPVRGTQHLREALSVVLRAPLWDVVGAHRYGIYYVEHPTAAGTFLPAGQGGRWLYGFEWDPTVERMEDYTSDRLIHRIRTAAGRSDLDVRLVRIGSFSFAASMAERFRDGPVFLVGDAAHRVTPRGGTGMNTAMADGFDLGWKLGWVLNGWAAESLLDSYERERRPVAEHNLARSIDPSGTRRSPLGEVNVDVGGRIRHLWLAQISDRAHLSTLDLVGPGLTLLTPPGGAPWDGAVRAVHERPGHDSIGRRTHGAGPGYDGRPRPDGTAGRRPDRPMERRRHPLAADSGSGDRR